MNTDHTLEEVGQQFSVTRERIRQAFAGGGAAEAEASEPVAEDAELFGSIVRTWTAILDDRQISISEERLKAFQSELPLSGLPSERVSDLLWFDLYVLQTMGWIDPHDILESIRLLERGRSGGIKAATPFRKPPLRGLWHQHYFSARFMAANMKLGLGKGGSGRVINEVMDPGRSSVVTREMINELAYRVTTGSLERRAAEDKLTGEWIVFAKAGDKNYYLCLGAHDSRDQHIYDRILQHCVRDFPELPEWLKSNSIEVTNGAS